MLLFLGPPSLGSLGIPITGEHMGGMSLFLGLLFGAVGSGFLIYAKRQYSASYAIAGALLIIFPYVISNTLLTFVIGVAISAAPALLERYGG